MTHDTLWTLKQYQSAEPQCDSLLPPRSHVWAPRHGTLRRDLPMTISMLAGKNARSKNYCLYYLNRR